MNIISHFKQILEQNFNNFIKKHFEQSIYLDKSSSFCNYINFMTDLDSFNYSLITDIIKSYFEYIDEVFFNASYRKSFCTAKEIYKRIDNNINISRVSARNIVMNFNINDKYDYDERKVERLFVMLDEKFVGSQFNDGSDHTIKAAVVFRKHRTCL